MIILLRNRVPWAVIAACYVICPMLLLLQRWYLDRENKKRDRDPPDTTYDDVWVKVTDEDGQIIEKRVDKVSHSYTLCRCRSDSCLLLGLFGPH